MARTFERVFSASLLSASLLLSNRADGQNTTGAPLSPQFGSQPAAVGPLLSYQARSLISVAGTNFNDALYQTPKGGAYDGVGSIFIERQDGNFICSGALIGGGAYMLTAAHCLANSSGQVITNQTTSVFFPAGQPSTTREFILSNQFFVHPLYTGQVIDAHDIAVIKLGSAPSAAVRAASYDLFSGNPFGQTAEAVGSGATGTGNTGITQGGGFTLADRRRGNNRVDLTWTDPRFNGFWNGFFGSADPYGLIADFDNGTATNDTGCRVARAVLGTIMATVRRAERNSPGLASSGEIKGDRVIGRAVGLPGESPATRHGDPGKATADLALPQHARGWGLPEAKSHRRDTVTRGPPKARPIS